MKLTRPVATRGSLAKPPKCIKKRVSAAPKSPQLSCQSKAKSCSNRKSSKVNRVSAAPPSSAQDENLCARQLNVSKKVSSDCKVSQKSCDTQRSSKCEAPHPSDCCCLTGQKKKSSCSVPSNPQSQDQVCPAVSSCSVKSNCSKKSEKSQCSSSKSNCSIKSQTQCSKKSSCSQKSPCSVKPSNTGSCSDDKSTCSAKPSNTGSCSDKSTCSAKPSNTGSCKSKSSCGHPADCCCLECAKVKSIEACSVENAKVETNGERCDDLVINKL